MIRKLILNIFIYFLSFLVIHYLKRGGITFFDVDTLNYFLIQAIVLATSFLSGKFRIKIEDKFVQRVKPYFISLIVSIGIISFYFNFMTHSGPSRIIISGTLFLGFLIELIYLTISSKFHKRNRVKALPKISPIIFAIDLILISFILMIVYSNSDNPALSFSRDRIAILVLLSTWLLSGLYTHHFNSLIPEIRIWNFLWKHVKGNILFVAFVSFAVFILSPEGMSSFYPVIISILYSIAEIIILPIYYYERTPLVGDEVVTKYLRATELNEEPILTKVGFESSKYKLDDSVVSSHLSEDLQQIYLAKYPELFNLINEAVDLHSVDVRRSIIIRSADPYNIEVLPSDMIEFYLNLHELNDMRRINEYFIKVNSKLISGGLFIGCLAPSSLRKARFNKSYPFYLANLFYFLDFIWKRVFPKLPFLKYIYFAFSGGRNRVVSLSEILGRLSYSGFELINMKQIEEKVYIIVKKVKEPLSEKNPSYGPFIKLKRIGKEGKLINVYKFRTMSPYSEYLQRFIFDNMSLQEGGKFKDDFRITSWGKFLRRFWLDELPMLINWLKGELKIVGVRPISKQYFSLYSEALQKRRIKFKPGLVPPFYYDLPKTLEEIMASEVRYLDSYGKSPLLTDIRYFFVSFYNIFFKKARSR